VLPDRIVDFYLDLGAEIVVLKPGERGVRLHCGGERHNIAGFRVDAIDANAAAALSTCRSGAVSSIPQRTQVEDFLQQVG